MDFNILLFAQVHLRMNLTNVVSSQLLHSKKKQQINKRKILFKGIKTHSSQSSKAWEILRQSKVTYTISYINSTDLSPEANKHALASGTRKGRRLARMHRGLKNWFILTDNPLVRRFQDLVTNRQARLT